MRRNKKICLIILSLVVIIIVGIIIGVTVHENNVEKEKKKEYKIIYKKIKDNGWEKNIESKKETYNSKMGRPEIQINYKDNPKITYQYTIINKNEVLGTATTNSDREIKKSDKKYEIE